MTNNNKIPPKVIAVLSTAFNMVLDPTIYFLIHVEDLYYRLRPKKKNTSMEYDDL